MSGAAFADWFMGDFIPFGDLVSDIWLWSTLPKEKPGHFNCSDRAYQVMTTLLKIGTVIDGIPEAAILMALVAGLMVVTTGMLSQIFSCPRRLSKECIRSVAQTLLPFLRYAFADGKATVGFLMAQTETANGKATVGFIMNHSDMEEKNDLTWDKTMVLVGWNVLAVTLMLPVKIICYNPSKKGLYTAMLWLQFIGGGLTEATSVFVAILGGDLVPILSSWFGLYSLCISMIQATVQLKQFRKSSVDRFSDVAMSRCSRLATEATNFLLSLLPAITYGGGVALVMWGVSFFLSAGVASYQAWLLVLSGSFMVYSALQAVIRRSTMHTI
ncbi:unnamed protein product [Ectocarpus sp. 6 AP-2014]